MKRIIKGKTRRFDHVDLFQPWIVRLTLMAYIYPDLKNWFVR